MATFNKDTKSNRILQSKRYTIADEDSQEAFSKVLDLNAAEIYTQQNLLPTSSLPYSGSGQDGELVSSSLADPSFTPEISIAKYYYRLELTPGNATIVGGGNKYQTWFTLSPPSANVDPQIISASQLTNWVSNKYLAPSTPTFTAESDPPGYNVVILKGATAVAAVAIGINDFQFDYKTGIVQFVSLDVAPLTTDKLWLSGYRYLGQTLADFVAEGGNSGTSGSSGTSRFIRYLRFIRYKRFVRYIRL
jgi:hypothetical protein